MFDLRFFRTQTKAVPLKTFEGHNNTYLYDLVSAHGG